jgi:hypothetical protein
MTRVRRRTMNKGECNPDVVLADIRRNPRIANGRAIFPNGTPDGANLLHGAARYGCFDVALILMIEYGADPEEEGTGMGSKGLTPYGMCEKHNDIAINQGK